ncbi:MAG: aminomethyl transferase family protein [Actinobacteria bacterium]|nr:MAG: aminomethyl transferase family protein [Actinomycetota bacterium]
MIRETPFHPRIAALNQTGLWSHWAGHLVAEKYQMSEKFEYFAVRNSAGVFDTSPLYKYRIDGADAERFLSGVMARDIRRCRAGRAQYTMWCDDRGHVVEDGVVLRLSPNEFLLTAAEPNLAYLRGLVGSMRVEVEDVSDEYAALAVQGPYAGRIMSTLAPEAEQLPYFGLTNAKIAGSPVVISRTGYTGDLGFEVWIEREHAIEVWDAIWEACAGLGVLPFGQIALLMTRIEAGLLLIGADFHSARYAWNDDQRDSPIELGYGWMFCDLAGDDRAFIGRRAIERELAGAASRWRLVGIEVDWQAWDRLYNSRHLVPPKDHVPEQGGMMLYDDEAKRAGYASSFMYSPLLQRHIGISKVRPELAEPGTRVQLEVTIDHRYDLVDAAVTRLPFYNPPRKTA